MQVGTFSSSRTGDSGAYADTLPTTSWSTDFAILAGAGLSPLASAMWTLFCRRTSHSARTKRQDTLTAWIAGSAQIQQRSKRRWRTWGVRENWTRLVLQLDVPLEVEWAGLPILRFLVLRLSCRRKMWAPCSLSSSATLVMSTGMQICWLNFLSQTKHVKYTGAASSAFEILDQYCHQGMSFGPRLRRIHQWELVTDPDSHYYAILKSVARNDFSCVPWICGMLWMITHITSYNIIITSHDII